MVIYYIEKDGNLFKAHPCFSKKGYWCDWAYFKWYDYDKLIPGRITTIIDLGDCDIAYETDQDPDTLLDDAIERIIPRLIIVKWVAVLAAKSPDANNASLNKSHF